MRVLIADLSPASEVTQSGGVAESVLRLAPDQSHILAQRLRPQFDLLSRTRAKIILPRAILLKGKVDFLGAILEASRSEEEEDQKDVFLREISDLP
jgi:hypothetical protein